MLSNGQTQCACFEGWNGLSCETSTESVLLNNTSSASPQQEHRNNSKKKSIIIAAVVVISVAVLLAIAVIVFFVRAPRLSLRATPNHRENAEPLLDK